MSGGIINLKREAQRAAEKYGLPPRIFQSLVTRESGWIVDAKSPAGAQGLTQLMPATAQSLGVDPYNPVQALDGGARYLKEQLDRFGSMRLALAAYNAGPGAVAKYGGVPPFKETQRYVMSIMGDSVPAPSVTYQPPAPTVKVGDPMKPLKPLELGALTPPPVGAVDPVKVAFDNLSAIGMGKSPTYGLSTFVDAVQQQQTPAVASTAPTAVPVASVAVVKPAVRPDSSRLPKVTPGRGWDGSEGVVKGIVGLGVKLGLKSTSEKRDNRYTTTGNTSDHWVGNKTAYAEDISNGYATPQMDKAAQEIAQMLGVHYSGHGPLEISKVIDGYRIQVLYRTHVGGNHFTHIHVGARRVS